MKFFSNKNKIFFFSFLIVLAFGFLGKPSDAFACSATNAVFRSNAGNDGDNFYHDLNRPYVYIDIQTQGCQGDSIQVSIVQSMGWGVDRDVGAADNKVVEINSETTNDFTLQFIAGEDWCGVYQPNLPNLFSLGYPPFMGGWDCKYYIQIIDDSGTQEFATTPVGNSSNMNLSGGSNLVYEITGITNVAWSEGNPLILAFGSSNENDQFNNANNVIPPIPPEDYYLAPLPGYEETCTDASCRLGNFLRSMFTIGIMVAGILAFIMIVVGAITYTTGGSISAKGAGKDMILNAVLGLLLALGCWVILNTINPNLASNLGINIPVVTLEGDTNIFATTFTSGTTAFSLPNDLGLYCPESGGSAAIPQIIDSFVGKVTYRFGGKGGDLPAGQNFTSSNGNSSMCTNDSGTQQQCGSFCPANSVCLDCSGFVNHVRKCSGLNVYGGTAGMVGHNHAKPVSMNTLSVNGQSLTVEGQTYQLQPGDILVWNGHVVVYYGDGKIAESRGSLDGLVTNSNIVKTPLAQYSHKNKITHIIKINP